jgi:hypothetical protein
VEFESTAHPDGSTLATIPSVQRSTPESPWQAYLCARSAHFFFRDGEEVQRYEALMHKHSFSGLTARILSRYLRMAKERGDR